MRAKSEVILKTNLLNKKISRKTHILREELDDETVLFNPKDKNTYVLNVIGAVIWELRDGMHNPQDITDEIVSVLPVNSDIVLNDVLKVIKDFSDQNLIDLN